MIPVSEVKTHPPSGSSPEEKAAKAKVHAKIAEAHFEEKEEGEGESEGPKVVRKDKSPEFQNPAKHASESSLLHFLLEQYGLSVNNVEEQVDILQNLEHFSHKYENGRELFGSTDVLNSILLPALNSSSSEIRKSACAVFAIAAQNNALVQLKSVESGVVRRLVHLMTFDTLVRPRALYALSSLIRNFPDAQRKFIQDGGVPALINVAFVPETRRRGLTLVTDLLNEREGCVEGEVEADLDLGPSDDPCDRLGLLVSALKGGGWCDLLEESTRGLPGFGEEDQLLIIESVSSSVKMCATQLSPLSSYFHQMLKKFEEEKEPSAVQSLENILSRLESPGVISSRIEL